MKKIIIYPTKVHRLVAIFLRERINKQIWIKDQYNENYWRFTESVYKHFIRISSLKAYEKR